MYCKYCGKIIEDDSVFCKYCGKIVESGHPLSKNKGITTRFLELSNRKQIAIIIYGIWILGWLCFLIANSDNRHFAEDNVMPFFLCTIVIPFMAVGGWHIYKITKGKNVFTNSLENKEAYSIQSNLQAEKINSQDSISSVATKHEHDEGQLSSAIETDISHQVFSSELLMSFARKNGKMQVVNKKLSDGDYDHYCQFTSEDGIITRVDFSDRTVVLSSKEISEKKYQLSVNKLADGTYYLDFMDEKQIDDSLPF